MGLNDQSDDLLTVKELATLIRKSRSAVHKLWPSWTAQYGLRPIRFNGRKRGRLLFAKSEVEAMIERWRVT